MTFDPNMPILIVDDYKTMLRIIRNLLKQLNFTNIDEAKDGIVALEKLNEKDFHLIISDWNMEPITGLTLLQKVRSNEKLQHIPFIMITAESKKENVIAAQESGVSDYIVKPFNTQTLKEKINKVLNK